MSPYFSDTLPEAECPQVEATRLLPLREKVQAWSDLNTAAREVLKAGLNDIFPSAAPGEIHRRMATAFLGQELATKAYGPEPDPSTITNDVVKFLIGKKARWDLTSLDKWPRELRLKELIEDGLKELG